MITFPNAKINLGLNIISKRPDRYHNISSCFYPIPFCDILEIQKADHFSFNSSGLEIPDNDENNLCVKAFRLIKRHYDISDVSIHLHKMIPMGAGLGGGSADASFTLKMINDLFGLGISNKNLEEYASELGSDCPFFIENQPVIAEDTGFTFSAAEVDLSNKFIVLTNPGIHVSTAKAYSGVTPKEPIEKINSIITKGFSYWNKQLINDFELSVFKSYPQLKEVKETLYENGAIYASMTGSGSSIYGIFEKEVKIPSSLSKQVCWKGFLK